MSNINTCTDSNSNDQVYGFLCPKTNVFYAFDSYETYQQFLDWLNSQQSPSDSSACQVNERQERPMINEADQMEDF